MTTRYFSKYGDKIIKGIIYWYDKHSKTGCIISLDHNWYRIHAFTKMEFVPKENEHITFKLVKDSIRPIIKWIKKSKQYKIKKIKRTPKVSYRRIRVIDQFTNRLITFGGYYISNYHWLEVRDNGNKLHAVTGMFNTPEEAIHMWNGTGEKCCGYS